MRDLSFVEDLFKETVELKVNVKGGFVKLIRYTFFHKRYQRDRELMNLILYLTGQGFYGFRERNKESLEIEHVMEVRTISISPVKEEEKNE